MSLVDRLVATSLPLVPKPIVRKVASPYIAGEKLDDLLRVSAQFNRDGYMVAAAVLGEFVSKPEEAEEAVEEYRELLDALKAHGVDAYIHVKPTHLGLLLDQDLCVTNLKHILDTAARNGQFVRMDMEDSPCTDGTLAVFHRLHEQYDNLGVVVQSRLRRTLDDVKELARVKANVRVCKGIYLEPYTISYTDPEIIRRNFTAIVDTLAGAGAYVAIATHDERLVWDSEQIIRRLNLSHDQYEFQMLLGVLPGLRTLIRASGHRLRVAVPFGPSWYAYSLRRLRKNPAIAGYVLKSFLKG
ncbi:MAG TPA: proline dehydrogenase family protein [Candidatus Krumholzibacteria bacterium]|nr:proline dehydrogenase family protein [Candidatus Krumholzibacteria bacterium]